MTERNQAESGETSSIGAFSPIPAARPLSDFAVEQVGDDLVILDGETLQYHTLNAIAAQIWQLCDGATTLAGISQETELPIEIVESTIAELGESGLLRSPANSWNSTLSRRRATRLIAAGLIGGVALPAIRSITAPDALAATSAQCRGLGAIGTCTSNANCRTMCGSAAATCVPDFIQGGPGCCFCGAGALQFSNSDSVITGSDGESEIISSSVEGDAYLGNENGEVDLNAVHAQETEQAGQLPAQESEPAPGQSETPAPTDTGGDAGNSGGDTSEPVETSSEEPTEEPAG